MSKNKEGRDNNKSEKKIRKDRDCNKNKGKCKSKDKEGKKDKKGSINSVLKDKSKKESKSYMSKEE